MSDETHAPTPNAVDLPVIPLAKRGVRLICALLDFVVIYVVTVALLTRYFWPKYYPDLIPEYIQWQEMAAKDPSVIHSMEPSTMMMEGAFFALALMSMVTWFYFVLSESWMRGATLGKAAFGLRVMSLRGTPPSALEIGVRASIKAMCFLIYFPVLMLINVFLMLLHRQHRAAHDIMAQTLVVAGKPSPAKNKQGAP